jgi:hypothetical protein
MKNIKLFKEMHEGGTGGEMPASGHIDAGHTPSFRNPAPITIELIKSTILDTMKSYNSEVDVEDPKYKSAIDELTLLIMDDFHYSLSYLSEEYENHVNDILALDENY